MATKDDDRAAATAAEENGAGAADPLGERNEKVLHARIPGSLDREIKRRARGLGMSVSTVVRNALLHTFDLVEDIMTDSARLAMSIAGEEGAAPERDPRTERGGVVVGWQEAVLNVNAVCDRCNEILAKGTSAAIGIREAPGPRSIICSICLAALRPPEGGARKDG